MTDKSKTEKMDHCSRAVSQSRRDEELDKSTPLTVEEYEKIRREAEAKEREKARKLKEDYELYEKQLRAADTAKRLADSRALEFAGDSPRDAQVQG